jgi:putative acetyltransferase
MFEVRREIPGKDLLGIRRVNERAFVKSGESNSYEHARYNQDALSLVALQNDSLIGHILFTAVRLETSRGDVDGMGLLLLAVDPDFQHRGIGRELTLQGIDAIKARTCPFIIVIGHADYYPRFGFRPGSACGLECQWTGVADQSFMALILDKQAMLGRCGVARYIDDFT